MSKGEINKYILYMATERGTQKSVCPSDVARALFPDDWRNHMQEIRDQATQLHNEGKVQIMQKGVPALPGKTTGPIRIKII